VGTGGRLSRVAREYMCLLALAHPLTVVQDCLNNIPTLESLELIVEPDCFIQKACYCIFRDNNEGSRGENGSFQTLVDAVFRRAADKVFQTLCPNRPEFVALRFRAPDVGSGYPYYCCAFVRSTVTGHLGQLTYEAVPVEPHMLKEHRFDSGIYQLAEECITADPRKMNWGRCRRAPWD
jgi:hypothetical protein